MNSPEPIDDLLRQYYRREMPRRWPAAPIGDAVVPVGRVSSLMESRFLVGASLVGLLALYLGLASFFPREHPAGGVPHDAPVIGQRPGPQK